MDKYIRRLIADIRESRTKIVPPDMAVWEFADVENEAEVEDLAYVQETIYGKPEPLSVITDIETGYLPVDDVLTPEQKSLLARELEALLNHYNFYADFPVNFPDEKKYKLLRAVWDSERVYVSFGRAEIIFCNFDIKTCPFIGYCDICEEMEKETREGPRADDTDISIEDLLPL